MRILLVWWIEPYGHRVELLETFDDLRTLTRSICFPSLQALMDFMMKGLKIGPYEESIAKKN